MHLDADRPSDRLAPGQRVSAHLTTAVVTVHDPLQRSLMWGDEQELETAERWVDDWEAAVQERAARASEMSRRVAGLSATARSGDGLIEVTVGSSGVLVGLHLEEGVRRHSAEWIAEQILTTVRAAQADLTAQVRDVAAATVGLDSEAGRAVVASYGRRLAARDGDDGAG